MTTTSTDHVMGQQAGILEDPKAFRSLIRELAAVSVDSTDLHAWERFATEVLGMTVTAEGDELRLKMDNFPYRFLIRKADSDGISGLTWVARGAGAVERIRERWENGGGASAPVVDSDWNSEESTVSYAFHDHRGVLHQVFDVAPSGQAPFEPGPNVSGYITGDAGLGHLVMFDNVDQMNVVYVDAFNMSLREDSNKTQVGGRGRFYGCNTRHHTAAAVKVPGKEPAVMHLMVEMLTIDDVGLALDRARSGGFAPRTTLGRHPDNDLSFYIPCPGGFDFEIGCDGLLVKSDDDWDANKHTMRAPSWGHEGISSAAPAK